MTVRYPPTKIEVFRPHITEEEIDAVAEVMRGGWIGRGPKVEEFEAQWAAHIGVNRENVVSVGCATEGLYQIMHWLSSEPGERPGDIIIPDNSFIGTASAILESGFSVKLCDINRSTLNPRYEHYISRRNESTVAMVFQHYGGFEDRMRDINAGTRHWVGGSLIEDFACHPLGRPVGDYAIYSFDAMKVLTCGDGGMIYARDVGAVEAIRQATRLGMTTESGKSTNSARWWEFRAVTPGRRSMMNDIGAAIGLVQLKRLPQMVKRRQEIWLRYQMELPLREWLRPAPEPASYDGGSFYTYWLTLPVNGMRDRLAHYLRERGIYSTYRYHSVSKAYGWDNVNVPNSHWADSHVLNLPLHAGLSDDDVSLITETVAEFGRTL